MAFSILNALRVSSWRKDIPYILAYKPTIFGTVLTFKLCWSAYTRVMPHSQESTVSMTAICQRRSLCVSRTWRGPLVGHEGYVYAWGRASVGFWITTYNVLGRDIKTVRICRPVNST